MTARFCLADCCKTPNVPMPAGDNSTACHACWARLEQQLAEMPTLVAELNTTISRQTATGLRNGPRGNEKPMAYDIGASDALDLLWKTLWPWVREGIESHPDMPFMGSPDVLGLTRALLWLYGWLQHHPEGEKAIGEINAATTNATQSIDIKDRPAYVGPCDTPDCPADLYVRPGAKYARCHLCLTVTDVIEKMQQAYGLATDRSWDLDEARTIIRNAGMKAATDDQVDRWTRSGRLTPIAHDTDNTPRYRLSDLIVDANA